MTPYERIEATLSYLIAHEQEQPSLKVLAQVSGVSESHFLQIFTEWAGVSPKQFLGYLTVEALKSEILLSQHFTETTERIALPSSSGKSDGMVKIEAVTPEEYKAWGRGWHMEYGFATSPFGRCLIAATPRGICYFQFVDGNADELLSAYQSEWMGANHSQNDAMAEDIIRNVFIDQNRPLNLHLKGTPFQIKVWESLLSIPSGSVTTYSELARRMKHEKAIRAVASAVARNPVGLIIPCHRVIRKEGIIGQYHWKSERKANIIGWEKAKRDVGLTKESGGRNS